jgi:hypothetical protein
MPRVCGGRPSGGAAMPVLSLRDSTAQLTSMNWQRLFYRINAMDFGAQVVLAIVIVVVAGLWKLFTR